MSYSGRPFFRIPRPLLLEGGVESKIIAANIELKDIDSLFQIIDGGAINRDVTLPQIKNGRVYLVFNSGASHDLVLKDQGGSTVGTIPHGEHHWVVCDGANWFVL